MVTESPAQVAEYGKQLAVYLDHCADYQKSEDPEFFLWNARRAAEAALIMMVLSLVGKHDGGGNSKTIEGLQQALQKRPEFNNFIAAAIANIQKISNIGSHAGLPEPQMPGMVKAVAPQLIILVKWVCSTLTLPSELNRQILALCDELDQGGRSALPTREAVTDLKREVQRLTSQLEEAQGHAKDAQIQREAQSISLRKAEAELSRLLGIQTSLHEAGQRVAALQHTVKGQEAALADKDRELSSLRQELSITVLKERNAQKKLDQAQKGKSLLPGCGTILAGLFGVPAVGLGVGAAVLFWLSFRGSPSPAEGALTLASPERTPPSAQPSTIVIGADTPAVEASVRPRQDCPDGMRLFEATTIQIGQPIGQRYDWPRPNPKEISPIAVGAFCVDRAPIRAADLQVDSATYRSFNMADCVDMGATNPDRDAATCATRDEAERYCKARGQRLPRIEEWEAIARSEGRAQLSTNLPAEWVEDRFPIAVFNLRDAGWKKGDGAFRMGYLEEKIKAREISAAGDVLYSWNQNPPDRRLSNRGFRCAQDL